MCKGVGSKLQLRSKSATARMSYKLACLNASVEIARMDAPFFTATDVREHLAETVSLLSGAFT